MDEVAQYVFTAVDDITPAAKSMSESTAQVGKSAEKTAKRLEYEAMSVAELKTVYEGVQQEERKQRQIEKLMQHEFKNSEKAIKKETETLTKEAQQMAELERRCKILEKEKKRARMQAMVDNAERAALGMPPLNSKKTPLVGSKTMKAMKGVGNVTRMGANPIGMIGLVSSLSGLGGAAAAAAVGVGAVVAALAVFAAAIANARSQIAKLNDLQKKKDSIEEYKKASSRITELQAKGTATENGLSGLSPKEQEEYEKLAGIVNQGVELLSAAEERDMERIQRDKDALQNLADIGEMFGIFAGSMWDILEPIFGGVEGVKSATEELKSGVAGLLALMGSANALLLKFWLFVFNKLTEISKAIWNIVEPIVNFFKEFAGGIVEGIDSLLKGTGIDIGGAVSSVIDEFMNNFNKIYNDLMGAKYEPEKNPVKINRNTLALDKNTEALRTVNKSLASFSGFIDLASDTFFQSAGTKVAKADVLGMNQQPPSTMNNTFNMDVKVDRLDKKDMTQICDMIVDSLNKELAGTARNRVGGL